MSFLSATRFGKKLCLSYHKVNEILFRAGLYDKSTKKPTDHAIANKYAEIKLLTNEYESGMTEYIAWDAEKIIHLFEVPTDIQKATYFTCRSNATDQILLAFHALDAIVHGDENRHSYCHLFDYGAFEGATTVADVDQLTVKTMTLTNELHKQAIKVDAARANLAYAVIESALIWLRKTIH